MRDSAQPPAAVPLPDIAVWRHIAIGCVDLSHLPEKAATLVRSRAWAALRADLARRTGIDRDAIVPGATGQLVCLPIARALHRVTILPPTSPGDAA